MGFVLFPWIVTLIIELWLKIWENITQQFLVYAQKPIQVNIAKIKELFVKKTILNVGKGPVYLIISTIINVIAQKSMSTPIVYYQKLKTALTTARTVYTEVAVLSPTPAFVTVENGRESTATYRI